jgi:hypothetical protein
MVGGPDPRDATLSRRDDLIQGVTGQVSQLHPLRLAHSGSTGFDSGA